MDPERARAVLGVSETASLREVRQAYLARARQEPARLREIEAAYHSLLAVPPSAFELTAPRPFFTAEEFAHLDRQVGRRRWGLWTAVTLLLRKYRKHRVER